MTDSGKQCELCGRTLIITPLTTHHLIPRTRHKNKKNKRLFSRSEVKERTVELCTPCHNQIHSRLTSKELERDFNTLESLQLHPEITKFIQWIKDKPDGLNIPTRQKKG